jgi:hypothetical protein
MDYTNARALIDSRGLNHVYQSSTAEVYSYIQIHSGKCSAITDRENIQNEEACRAYAMSIGGTYGSKKTDIGLPSGCYFDSGEKQWNFKTVLGTDCTKDNFCACRFVAYQEVTEDKGQCDERPEYASLTLAECKVYGKNIAGGYASTGSYSSKLSTSNKGCHRKHDSGSYSYFWSSGASGKCSTTDKCICKMQISYNYVLRKEGKCLAETFPTNWQCKIAANMHGETNLGSRSEEESPYGCTLFDFYGSDKWIFNPTNTAHDCSDTKPCLCLSHPPKPNSYTTTTTGTCNGGVTMTQLECAQYAHQRSFGFGTTPETTTSVPNGCYQTSDKVLHFKAAGGTADCSNDHKCICAPFENTWYVSTVSTGVTPFYMTEIDAGACSDVIGRSELSESECW